VIGLSAALPLAERGYVPDWISRMGIRRLLKTRLDRESRDSGGRSIDGDRGWGESLQDGPLALHTDKANEQHYELPPEFFTRVLGRRMKYSSCYWPKGVASLDDAEAAMLSLTCERAGLRDGQSVLELGCGWGSLTLWMAERYPSSTILAMSNSAPQRRFIESRAAERGLSNIRVVTRDINRFDTELRFDRIVSVEMFEHVRNHARLMDRIHGWLNPGGALFVHVFCHREFTYPFETEGSDNWMGRYFFTGGIMPSADLLPRSRGSLRLEEKWSVNGRHYALTARAWLENLDRRRGELLPILKATYGGEAAAIWLSRWRLFFMACEELFGFADGEEWGVGHYRFGKDDSPLS
jgi:cyclopropane-fatty-acyl-phospholipid synthase